MTVTRDLSFAKVYISLLESDDEKIAAIIKVLNHASGFIRSVLSQKLTARKVPQLSFVYDSSIRYGNRLSQLIDEAVAADDETPKE